MNRFDDGWHLCSDKLYLIYGDEVFGIVDSTKEGGGKNNVFENNQGVNRWLKQPNTIFAARAIQADRRKARIIPLSNSKEILEEISAGGKFVLSEDAIEILTANVQKLGLSSQDDVFDLIPS